MSKANDIIHQATRLKIMSVLNTLEPGQAIEFVRLRQIIKATDGNLGAHLEVLSRAKLLIIRKKTKPKPTTFIKITSEGRRAFQSHVNYLMEIINDDYKNQ